MPPKRIALGLAAVVGAAILFRLDPPAIVSAASSPAVKATISARGDIEVVDPASGRVIASMPAPKGVVREVHALDAGKVVATTKRDVTEFWNPATRQLVRRFDERIYLFSPSQKFGISFSPKRELKVVEYPALRITLVLGRETNGGPAGLVLSGDERFLAVQYGNQYPLSDEAFANPVFDKTYYWVEVYDVRTGRQVPDVGGAGIGSFTTDSRFYVTDAGQRYDLAARRFVSPSGR